jgi:hypothetical protein
MLSLEDLSQKKMCTKSEVLTDPGLKLYSLFLVLVMNCFMENIVNIVTGFLYLHIVDICPINYHLHKCV